jgi:hypothetical protein
MAYRVIQCFSGAVGKAVIRLAARDPRIDIVGLYVHHAEKEGRDAGALAGIAANGVIATRDLAALLAAGADCAIWCGDWNGEVIARILRAGVNVFSFTGAYYRRGGADAELVQRACEEGRATLVGGGNVPGLLGELPLFLSGYTGQVSQLRVWQRNHVPDLPSANDLIEGVGFGLPCDPSLPAFSRADGWANGLRQSAFMLADAFGVVVDDFAVTSVELAPAPRDLPLPQSGITIRQGAVAGIRWLFTGHARGKPFYQVNVEMTVALGLGPGWRKALDEPNWRIELDGTPSLMAEVTVPPPIGPGIIELNAARAVNAVPRVVEAPAGCRSILDFATVTASATPG